MCDLSLFLLGAFEAVYDQRPLTQFRTKAVQALLIYLVAQREQMYSREALMTLLWPELPTKSAQGNLRHALYHLRQTIPEITGVNGGVVPFLLTDRKTVQINPDGRYYLDLVEFETAARSSKSADLETAVSLYRSDFLTDFYLPDSPAFDSWVLTRRATLSRHLLNALTRLTEEQIAERNFEQAEKYARRQLEIDNLREEAHRQMMMVLAETDRRTDALIHYQSLRQLLQDELDIAPSAATAAFAEAIRNDNFGKDLNGSERKVPVDAPHSILHNLPRSVTPFIGRQTELSTLDALFAARKTRLITISGAGGIGKTRLALAAAENQLAQDTFAEGVFFVPLTDLNERERIVSAIAEAMQVRIERGEEQLFNYLRAKQILLVLDNFEPLLAATALPPLDPPAGEGAEGTNLISHLLQAAPKLQILVTSRERLHLQGEQVFPIQGLLLDETAVTDDARALFLQAARRLRPDFAVTAVTLPALNHICRLVDGMPLALELAAAWVDLFTLEDIAVEIQRNLDFLESDLRDMPSRHRSMQTVFDTSWRQLSPNQQQLLANVSVFRGGFTREAVTAVAKASLRDLAVLVNKSLLTFDTVNGRYTMHKLLRQYAAAKPEWDATVRDRHCDHYFQLIAAQIDRLYGSEQMMVVRRLQVDMDNIRTAITHALRQERFADLDAILPTLAEYYRVCGQRQEGIRLYQPIYDALRSQPEIAPLTLFWTTFWLSEFHGVLSNAHEFEAYHQQVKEMLETPFFRQQDTREEQAVWLHQEGYRLIQQEPTAAVKLFRQSYSLIESLGDKVWLARSLIGLARAARNADDLDLAQEAIAQSFALSQSLGNPLYQIEARLLMGNLAVAAGNYDQAEAWLHECIANLRYINHPDLLGLGLFYLIRAQENNGRFQAALQTVQEQQQVVEKSGGPYQHTSIDEAQILLHLGEYKQCAALGKAALRAAQATQETWIIVTGMQLLGLLALVKGDMVEARFQLQASEVLLLKSRSLANIFSNQIWFGLIAAIEEESAVAQKLITQMLQEAIEQHHALKLAVTIAVAACLRAVQQQPEHAIALYTLAQQNPFVSNSRWFADVVQKRIMARSAKLTSAEVSMATAKGEAMDMWETAVFLQEWLAKPD